MSSGLIFSLLGLLAGAVIGYTFGLLQSTARLRSKKRAFDAQCSDGWSVLASKGARLAFLLITLGLIQVICPFLFRAGTQWWISGGVLLGYAWTLVRQIALRLKEEKA